MTPIIGGLLASADKAVDRMTEQAIAGKGFAVDDKAYHAGYDALRALWKQAGDARRQVQAKASAIQPSQVSNQIPGIAAGATHVQDALVVDAMSLDRALATVQARIATLLNAMYASYVDYANTDQESAFDLVKAASTS